MPTLLSAAVCCLAMRFEWSGQELQAGRRPFYGAEVPNVKRSSAEPPGTRESILYPLSPARFGFLAGMTASGHRVAVVLEPPLPPTPGELRVRLTVVPCPQPVGSPAPLPPPGARAAEFKVSALLPVREGPGAGTELTTVARGLLSEAAPLDLVLRFPHEAAPEEQIELVVASMASPEAEVRLSWSRFRHPGQERFTWAEPPPPEAAAPAAPSRSRR